MNITLVDHVSDMIIAVREFPAPPREGETVEYRGKPARVARVGWEIEEHVLVYVYLSPQGRWFAEWWK